MSDIIEKLGIKPVMFYSFDCKEWITTEHDRIREIERNHDEMLEALIDLVLCDSLFDFQELINKRDKYQAVVEKATGKSWQEIKELL